MTRGTANDGVGVLYGNRTYLMQDEDGLIKETLRFGWS